jgi:hypothetical protein
MKTSYNWAEGFIHWPTGVKPCIRLVHALSQLRYFGHEVVVWGVFLQIRINLFIRFLVNGIGAVSVGGSVSLFAC